MKLLEIPDQLGPQPLELHDSRQRSPPRTPPSPTPDIHNYNSADAKHKVAMDLRPQATPRRPPGNPRRPPGNPRRPQGDPRRPPRDPLETSRRSQDPGDLQGTPQGLPRNTPEPTQHPLHDPLADWRQRSLQQPTLEMNKSRCASPRKIHGRWKSAFVISGTGPGGGRGAIAWVVWEGFVVEASENQFADPRLLRFAVCAGNSQSGNGESGASPSDRIVTSQRKCDWGFLGVSWESPGVLRSIATLCLASALL